MPNNNGSSSRLTLRRPIGESRSSLKTGGTRWQNYKMNGGSTRWAPTAWQAHNCTGAGLRPSYWGCFTFSSPRWIRLCGWLLVDPQNGRGQSYGYIPFSDPWGTWRTTELEENASGGGEHMSWLCHPPQHPSSADDGKQTHHGDWDAGAPYTKHEHDGKGHRASIGQTPMGYSGLPSDEEPHAKVLGLEDGSYCNELFTISILGTPTQDGPLIGPLDEGALHHSLSAALPLPTQVPLVGMQWCQRFGFGCGLHWRMAVGLSDTSEELIPWAFKDGNPKKRIAALKLLGTLVLAHCILRVQGKIASAVRIPVGSDNQSNVFSFWIRLLRNPMLQPFWWNSFFCSMPLAAPLLHAMYLENSINGRMISRTRSLVAFPQSSTSMWVAFLHSLILYPDSLQEWISIFLMSPPKIPWPDLVGCPVPFSPFKPGVASLASIGLAEISTWHTWLIEFGYCTDTVWSIPESQIQGTRTNWHQPLRKSKRARVGAQLTLVWRGHFFHTYIHSVTFIILPTKSHLWWTFPWSSFSFCDSCSWCHSNQE